MNSGLNTQRGATLFVTLVALVILTLLAVVAIRSSTMGLLLSGNAQVALEAEAAAQAGIDRFIGNIANFEAPLANAAPPTEIIVIGGRSYSVVLPPPRCQSSNPAPGYSLVQKPGGGPPMDQIWQVSATAGESNSSALVAIVQGVKVRMPVGALCPN